MLTQKSKMFYIILIIQKHFCFMLVINLILSVTLRQQTVINKNITISCVKIAKSQLCCNIKILINVLIILITHKLISGSINSFVTSISKTESIGQILFKQVNASYGVVLETKYGYTGINITDTINYASTVARNEFMYCWY